MNNRGIIGYVGLEEWWDYELKNADRNLIVSGWNPLALGSENSPPDRGYVVSRTDVNDKPVTKLRVILDLLNADVPYDVKVKIINKGKTISADCPNPLDVHFFYGTVLAIEYRRRDEEPNALENAIFACKAQIAVASKAKTQLKKSSAMRGIIPSHAGYKQLAIILEKQKKYKEAIRLCEKADKQGWSGDWDRRIERCQKKMKD